MIVELSFYHCRKDQNVQYMILGKQRKDEWEHLNRSQVKMTSHLTTRALAIKLLLNGSLPRRPWPFVYTSGMK